ncbi:MAG: hypothetical protein AAF589_05705 [Planctomycetota bacterium]
MSTGKSLLLVVGGVFGGVLLMVGSCAGLIYYGYSSTSATAGPRIDDAFKAIASGKAAAFYQSETNATFKAASTQAEFQTIAELVRERLGPLRSKSMKSFNARSVNGESFMEVTYGATFENGLAGIIATLCKEGDAWKFEQLRVNSPLLAAVDDAEEAGPEGDGSFVE